MRVADKIAEEEERLERSLFTCDGKKDISAVDDSPALLLKDLKVNEQPRLEKPKIVRRGARSVTPTRPIVASYQRETISTSLKKFQTRSESRGSATRSNKPVSAIKTHRRLTTECKLRPKSALVKSIMPRLSTQPRRGIIDMFSSKVKLGLSSEKRQPCSPKFIS